MTVTLSHKAFGVDEIRGMTVLVLGLGRSGLAASNALKNLGSEVRATDSRPEEDFGKSLDSLRELGVELSLGGSPVDFASGCDMLVISPGIPLDNDVVEWAKTGGIPVISEVELAYCLTDARIVGVTGTNGKTTVKNLLGAILQKRNITLLTKKNYNSLIGLPLTLFDLSSEEDYLVVEMGTSSPGEIKRLCEIAQPHIGVITNIGPGHLKGLGSLAGVRREKLSLLEALPEAGFALIGEGISDVSGKNVLRFSLDMCKDIELSECGSSFTFNGNRFFTALLGIENVYNCAAALCLTRELGFDHDAQRIALAEIRPEPGRLESIHINGLLIVNDTYNANPNL